MSSTATKSTVRVLSIVSTALSELDTISEVASGILSGAAGEVNDKVLTAARTIHAIVESILQGLGGTLSTSEVRSAIDKAKAELVEAMAANDQAADAAVAAKFPTT